ncbi:general odorant-binding protein 68-like [Culicoides brevitarsis]|uniref:general odorant-binding protein 68-like n=1 Tax=Culicoides brevitarsis TaxID=469753 RepID=UPI00307C0343
MLLKVHFLVVFCVFNQVQGKKSSESKEDGPVNCNKFPGTHRSILGCCNYPFLQHDETSVRCMSDGAYVYGPPLRSNCFVYTCAFKNHQKFNSSISEENYLDFMIDNYVHWKWLRIISPVIEECKSKAFATDLTSFTQPPYNIDPERCFLPFLSFTSCIYTYGFRNCHGDMWLKSKNCQKWMKFFNTCDSIDNTPKLLEVIPFLNF